MNRIKPFNFKVCYSENSSIQQIMIQTVYQELQGLYFITDWFE